MRVVVFVWIVAAACSFRPAPNTATDGSSNDIDSATGGGPTSCFDSGTAFAFCVPTPTGPVVLGTASGNPLFHTGNAGAQDACSLGTYAMVGTTDACVVAGTTVTLAAMTTLVAVDDYPLVIASTGDVDIAGVLDVSTQNGGQHGAGHNPSECATGNGGHSNQFGGGGGGGGTFGTQGGAGGMGGNAGGGSAAQPVAATRLRGGCPGGTGGTGGLDGNNNPAPGGNAGFGGGAVLVVASGKISIEGTINASGECGYGGQSQGGGGAGGSGGASGGMIVLAGASYDIPGVLVANGGGGGGGGDQVCCDVAGTGGLASTTMPQMAAAGGTQVAHGGHGGTGAATNVANVTAAMAGAGPMNNGGGGGGGGGEGVIGYLAGTGTFPPASNRVSPQAMAF